MKAIEQRFPVVLFIINILYKVDLTFREGKKIEIEKKRSYLGETFPQR